MNTTNHTVSYTFAAAEDTVDIRTLPHTQVLQWRTEAGAAGDWDGVKACDVVLSGLTQDQVQAMWDAEDVAAMPQWHDYLSGVRAEVVDSIVADGSVVEDAGAEFDVDAIVDAVTLRGEVGGRDVYWIAVDTDRFWAAVQRYAR